MSLVVVLAVVGLVAVAPEIVRALRPAALVPVPRPAARDARARRR